MIAALYVETDGCYYGLPGVDPWDVHRDARGYAGPHPVIAHPPCKRWGRYWSGGPSAKVRRKLGDDGGCFAAALAAVRQWGGIIEHPEASHAWLHHGLNKPPRHGGWVVADWHGGWTCCVEQGAYGHPARKATWLYANGVTLRTLQWRSTATHVRLDTGYHSAEERRTRHPAGVRLRHNLKRQSLATPLPFRDLLISIASTALHTGVQRGIVSGQGEPT